MQLAQQTDRHGRMRLRGSLESWQRDGRPTLEDVKDMAIGNTIDTGKIRRRREPETAQAERWPSACLARVG